jgi:hypothetical protein
LEFAAAVSLSSVPPITGQLLNACDDSLDFLSFREPHSLQVPVALILPCITGANRNAGRLLLPYPVTDLRAGLSRKQCFLLVNLPCGVAVIAERLLPFSRLRGIAGDSLVKCNFCDPYF